jgi:hypothetical protein
MNGDWSQLDPARLTNNLLDLTMPTRRGFTDHEHLDGVELIHMNGIKNQPWNVMPMRSAAFHTSVHGQGKNAFSLPGQLYYGTPQWFKATTAMVAVEQPMAQLTTGFSGSRTNG